MSREEQAKQEDKKMISDFNEGFTKKKYGDSKNWTQKRFGEFTMRTIWTIGTHIQDKVYFE